MAKTPKQQEQLNHIWHNLHEKQGRSAEAAAQARQLREEYQTDPEMVGELAAMEMVTAGAAAKKSRDLTEAYPYFVQAVEVVKQSFPLASTEVEALNKGNALDPVYGEVSAQLEMLRSYYHLVERLSHVLANEGFNQYALQLWQFLSSKLSEANKDEALLLLTIEYADYAQALSAYSAFQTESRSVKTNDSSRIITISGRMLNRALVESDYETALLAFQQAIKTLARDRTKLAHFGKQIATNVRADKTIAQNNKLKSWSMQGNDHDLAPLLSLKELVYIGLGNDRVEELT